MFTVTSHPLRAAISFFVIYPAAHSFNTVFTTASRFGRAFARFSSACLPTILFLLIGTFIFFPVYRNARMFFVTSPPHRAAIFAVIFRISVAAQSYHIFSLHCAEITFARFSSASIPAILWVGVNALVITVTSLPLRAAIFAAFWPISPAAHSSSPRAVRTLA